MPRSYTSVASVVTVFVSNRSESCDLMRFAWIGQGNRQVPGRRLLSEQSADGAEEAGNKSDKRHQLNGDQPIELAVEPLFE